MVALSVELCRRATGGGGALGRGQTDRRRWPRRRGKKRRILLLLVGGSPVGVSCRGSLGGRGLIALCLELV